jgi:hypothetical protein
MVWMPAASKEGTQQTHTLSTKISQMIRITAGRTKRLQGPQPTKDFTHLVSSAQCVLKRLFAWLNWNNWVFQLMLVPCAKSYKTFEGLGVTIYYPGEPETSRLVFPILVGDNGGNRMLYWGRLEDATLYVIDLIQLPDGTRGIRFRKPDEPVHDNTVLQSRPYAESRLKQFGSDRFPSEEIQTTDDRQFGLDPHDIWMTKE